jgi:hypothetical protein
MTAVVVLASGIALGGAVAAAAPDAAPETPPPSRPPDAMAPGDSGSIPRGPKAPLKSVMAKPKELGPEHKLLSGFVGAWKSKVHVLQDTAAAVQQDVEGNADGKLIMGGRFVQVMHSGLINGQPFEGMMILGFDNVINRYVSIWINNGGTAMIHFVGTYDAAKKQLTMSSHFSDPSSRRLTILKTVTTLVDANNWVYDEYTAHAVGEKEAHTVSITYKR